ncbi:MAG: hypothetical protein WC511_07575 [Candidatus Pacearchaeota archaeon]|jgi:hypothetical protein
MKAEKIYEIFGGILLIQTGERTLKIIGHVNPIEIRSIRENLGKELKYDTREAMLRNLSEKTVPVKTFEKILQQPNTGRLIGIRRDPATDEVIFRIVGFINPKETDKLYKKLLAEKGEEEEIPYWEKCRLGKEWRGTSITRGYGTVTLANLQKPVTKAIAVEYEY